MSDLKKPITWPEIDCSGELAGADWAILYQDLQRMRQEEWRKLALAYERNPGDFYTAWHWLQKHPIFWYFGKRRHESLLATDRGIHEGLEFEPAMVHPETQCISDVSADNTRLAVWVEVFPASLQDGGRDGRLHDYECDTGGDTYEDAVVAVAREIYNHHGNDREHLRDIWRSA